MGASYAEMENWPSSAEVFALILPRKDLNADDKGGVGKFRELVLQEGGQVLAALGGLAEEIQELKAEGDSLCSFEIEPVPNVDPAAVKLTVTHSMEHPESKFIQAVSGGWPQILSNLKSLLETGHTLPQPPWEMYAELRDA